MLPGHDAGGTQELVTVGFSGKLALGLHGLLRGDTYGMKSDGKGRAGGDQPAEQC